MCSVEIGAIEPTDCDGKDELQEAEDKVEDHDREGGGTAGRNRRCGLLVEARERHGRYSLGVMALLMRKTMSVGWRL